MNALPDTAPLGGKRYLVISAQGFGDSLEATPMVAALRHAAPDAVIDVLVTQRPPKQLFEGLPHLVNDVIYLPLWESGRRAFVKDLLRKRWRKRYDATFLTYPGARWEYQLLSWIMPAKRRYGHRYSEPSLTNLLWLNTDLCPVRPRHNVLRNMDLLQMAGMEPETPSHYVVPAAWKDRSTPRERRRITAHVGTVTHHGRESRRWPLEYFVEVLNRCTERGFDVWLLMGPSELEETQFVHERVHGSRIFSGNLEEAARFLSTSGLVLSNDNGIGHLAAGVGTPVVTLFGPTPLEHAPYGKNVLALRPTACTPCFDVRKLYSKCELGIDYQCLRIDLKPDDVYRAMMHLLRPTVETVSIDLNAR